MARKTVKILMPGDKAERDFHLFDHQIERFVAQVERDGGQARVVPFQMCADMIAMLTKAGVNAEAIK